MSLRGVYNILFPLLARIHARTEVIIARESLSDVEQNADNTRSDRAYLNITYLNDNVLRGRTLRDGITCLQNYACSLLAYYEPTKNIQLLFFNRMMKMLNFVFVCATR